MRKNPSMMTLLLLGGGAAAYYFFVYKKKGTATSVTIPTETDADQPPAAPLSEPPGVAVPGPRHRMTATVSLPGSQPPPLVIDQPKLPSFGSLGSYGMGSLR